jgi:hypothetical protein
VLPAADFVDPKMGWSGLVKDQLHRIEILTVKHYRQRLVDRPEDF